MERYLEGLVTSTAGIGARRTGWGLVLFLCPSLGPDGEVRERPLRVTVPMTSQTALARAISAWRGAVVRLRVTRFVPPSSRSPWGLAVGARPLRRIQGAPALRAAERRLAVPRVVTHRLLGRLTLERDTDAWEGKRATRALAYRVSVRAPAPGDARSEPRELERAAAVVRSVERRLAAIRAAIADSLLATFNDSWRHDGPRVSKAGFKARVTLRALEVSPTRTTLYLGCDGMFTDHGIEVRMSPRGRIQEIGIA